MRKDTLTIALRSFVVHLGACIVAFAATPRPAEAQSLLQLLFGEDRPPRAYSPPVRLLPPASAGPGPAGMGMRAPMTIEPGRSNSPSRGDDGKGGPTELGQTFRTVCVRMCDGYYWPVSHATTRSRFHRDANVCQASCSGEARLFFFPSSGGIEDAVDQTGRAYARLTTAFRYRKTVVQGCQCKPEPWSEAEMIRHGRYAMEEKAAEAKSLAAAGDAATDSEEAGDLPSASRARPMVQPPAPAERSIASMARIERRAGQQRIGDLYATEARARRAASPHPNPNAAEYVRRIAGPPPGWGPPLRPGYLWRNGMAYRYQ